VAKRLGDLIDYYVTVNEPNQLVYGYIKGFWMRSYPVPPGLEPFATGEQQMSAVLTLIPNLFRAHCRARDAIHAVHRDAMVGSNPLVLGLPRWLQRLVDRNATHLKSPEDARRHARRMSQHFVVETGQVDISMAQITMTQERMSHVLFSEPYAVAHEALLHPRALALPEHFETWKSRIGVVEDAPTAALVGGVFTAAALSYYRDVGTAVEALRNGRIDAVFDLDLLLRQYANAEFDVTPVPGRAWPIGVVMALGSRTLLNAVDRALRTFKASRPDMPTGHNRKTVSDIGKGDGPDAAEGKGDGADATDGKADTADTADGDAAETTDGRMTDASDSDVAGAVPDLDPALSAIRKRGVLRVGVRPGVDGLCTLDADGNYTGLEPDIARAIAQRVLGDAARVRFVALRGKQRLAATRSPLRIFDGFRKSLAMFGTLVGTNWWNLGMAGKLPPFLCPSECIGALDYVGIDYYWGVSSVWPGTLHRLSAVAECHYGLAPVWPYVLDSILREAEEQFPGKPIIVIENGCVTSADGFSRARYLEAHIAQVERALRRGSPIAAYLCWSITSNREWGLPFDDNSDFGLYHIDLDRDPELKRVPTEASRRYAQLIASAPRTQKPLQ
jgi:ABC-type amino acid transport substrate-binding protein